MQLVKYKGSFYACVYVVIRVVGLQLPHCKGIKRTVTHKYRRPTSPSQQLLFLLQLNTIHSAGDFYRIHENSKQETDINKEQYLKIKSI